MQYLIDEIARSLASETPRRHALKAVLAALGATFLAQKSNAATAACSPRCSSNQTCCTTGSRPFCVTQGKTCCGNAWADSSHVCCQTGSSPFVAAKGTTCCGNTSADSSHICCQTGSSPFVITQGKTCCGNAFADSGHICCQTGSSAFVATKGKICCGHTVCTPEQKCVNGRCVASNS